MESVYQQGLKRLLMRPPRDLMLHMLEMQQRELEDLAWYANIGSSADALANAYAGSLDIPQTELVGRDQLLSSLLASWSRAQLSLSFVFSVLYRCVRVCAFATVHQASTGHLAAAGCGARTQLFEAAAEACAGQGVQVSCSAPPQP